ncbi:MAG: hypothetical protein K8R59_05020 [Thermoanaerobaculales bacterium]|nr:hypothetical protein [Thermoanaerobaculales bacterium]
MVRALLIPALIVGALCSIALPATAGDGVVGVGSDLRVDNEVQGDAVVLLGDLIIGPHADVHGDAVAVLGCVRLENGARVRGKIVGVRSLSNLDLDPVAAAAAGSTRLGLILLALGAWLFATSLIAYIGPAWVHEGVRQVRALGWRVIVFGVFSAATFLAALVAVLGLGPGWGVPLSGLLTALFVGVKIVGMTVIGAWLGSRLLVRWSRGRWPVSLEVFAGVLFLVGLRVVPVVGGLAWNILSIVALGAGAFALIAQQSPVTRQVPARADHL